MTHLSNFLCAQKRTDAQWQCDSPLQNNPILYKVQTDSKSRTHLSNNVIVHRGVGIHGKVDRISITDSPLQTPRPPRRCRC